MAQWIIGTVVGAYTSMTTIPLNVPGALRRIESAFYMNNGSAIPVPLTPVVTADVNGEVQIYGRTGVRIFQAGLSNIVVFLFCDIELAPGEPIGTKQTITP